MARLTVRMPIPDDPSEAIRLLTTVREKHTELGTASPLAGLEWGRIDAALGSAQANDALSDKCYRDAEKATKERNLQMPLVNEALRSARDVLLGTFRSNPKKAGDFGFTVNDSPRSNATGDNGGSGTTVTAQSAPAK